MILHDRVALVTGASSGIGRAVARQLALARCRLLLTALEPDELTAAADGIRSGVFAGVECFPADLSDGASREALLAWVRAQGAPIDILVSNAGGGWFRRFARAPWADLARTIALNAEAPTHLIRELLPLLRNRPEACIVLISSGIARLPYPGLAVYGACKGYLSSLGESLTCELLGTSVRVLVFHPGFTQTHFMEAAGMDMRRVPAFMIGTPERVARKIVRCLKADRQWSYSDLSSRLAAVAGPLLPSRLRVRILQNLFWRLPDEG